MFFQDKCMGLFFIILAQLLCAIQIVIEEHLMTSLHVTPVMLVGFEGLWGLLFYIPIAPILTLTPNTGTSISKIWHEDFLDSIIQVSNSPTLMVLILFYIISVGSLNV